MISSRRTRDGFTLVELMLTITLVAVVLVETGVVFRTASRAYRRFRQETTAVATADDALWLIGRDVAHAACPTDPARPPVLGAAYPLLRLRTTGPATVAGRAEVVDYFLYTDDAGHQTLVRRGEAIQDVPIASGGAAVVWEVVARDVTGFALRYFDGQAWMDRWDPRPDVVTPVLIEVTLTVRAADGREITRRRVLALEDSP